MFADIAMFLGFVFLGLVAWFDLWYSFSFVYKKRVVTGAL